MTFQFRWAWMDGSWSPQVRVSIDEAGRIKTISAGHPSPQESPLPPGCHYVPGLALPGMVNLHSHAFQWALAGRSEFRTASEDSFWTWRAQMFRLLQAMDDDLLYRISLDAYRRMVRAGYTTVGEFHYVHLHPNGNVPQPVTRYADAVVQAALDAGISICLLPTLYQRGGFDNEPLGRGQHRFALSSEQFKALLEALRTKWADHHRVRVGMALHSLRAVAPESLLDAVEWYRRFDAGGVVHIHAAEQTAEVDQCLRVFGRRPVQWILDECEVDERWCLIHATHTTDEELRGMAAHQVVAGLCPSTEANLGDGIFDADLYRQLKGRWGIGSDSQVTLDPAMEIRLLEYGQRWSTRRRAVLAEPDRSCGEYLFFGAARGGAQALGIPAGELQVGYWADLLVIDLERAGAVDDWQRQWSVDELMQPPEFASVARALDRFVFTGLEQPPRVMIGGRWCPAPSELR